MVGEARLAIVIGNRLGDFSRTEDRPVSARNRPCLGLIDRGGENYSRGGLEHASIVAEHDCGRAEIAQPAPPLVTDDRLMAKIRHGCGIEPSLVGGLSFRIGVAGADKVVEDDQSRQGVRRLAPGDRLGEPITEHISGRSDVEGRGTEPILGLVELTLAQPLQVT